LEPKGPAGAHCAQGDFSPIGDQDAFHPAFSQTCKKTVHPVSFSFQDNFYCFLESLKVILMSAHEICWQGERSLRLTFEEVNQIVSLIDKSTCEELMIEADDLRLVVRKNSPSAPVPETSASVARHPQASRPAPVAATPVATVKSAPEQAGNACVTAPMVGMFYRAPAPDKPAFVEAGSLVAEGDPLCLIEVMKLFTTVFAPSAGRVEWVFPQDGTLVEFDQTLFVIAPA